jgi:chromosome segregation ATPase
MSKPTIKSLTEQLEQLRAKHAREITHSVALQARITKLEGSPKVQDKLNMANKTVAELMEQNDELVRRDKLNNEQYKILQLENKDLSELAHIRLHEITCKASSLKTLHEQKSKLESDYQTMADNFEANINQCRAISAENHALKSEIERTNRHINLAENVINAKEQQPLVVNHYHNCTINK